LSPVHNRKFTWNPMRSAVVYEPSPITVIRGRRWLRDRSSSRLHNAERSASWRNETQELLNRAQHAIDEAITLREHTEQCIAAAESRCSHLLLTSSSMMRLALPPPDASRDEQAKRAVQEHIDDQRALLKKLGGGMN
jgi:hypothetical protein